jgi:ribosomal protein S18 acetylase RimI-like enzyme
MHIRRLSPEDAAAFQALRLAALQEAPSAFGSSFEEESEFPPSVIEGRLALKPDRGPFGAFEGEELVGLVALGRESMKKLAHKALVWGMYVKPEHRGKGIGKALLCEALSLARSVPEVTQVNLGVNAANTGAIHLYMRLPVSRCSAASRARCASMESFTMSFTCTCALPMPNPSIERTRPGKPGRASHVKR